MSSISLCMIVKNESQVIERCLKCVSDLVDEIVIVDTGSTDDTMSIARKFTDSIYEFPWIDDFSAARNFSFSKATKEYIMWLDADDIILDEDRIKLRQLKSILTPTEHDMVMMKYNVAFDENEKPTFSYYRERIVKNKAGYLWTGPIHEVICPLGNVIYSDVAITHKKMHENEPFRNLNIFRKMLSKGINLDARQQFYYARELYYNGLYEDAIKEFSSFLCREDGWIENRINACQDLAYCYYRIKEDNLALRALLKSLELDQPRAEICCDIGRHFFDRKNYKVAIFWYELAATRKLDQSSGGFKMMDCYGYIPYLQLCVCYDRIGDREKAIKYNEMAAAIKPNDAKVLYNRAYFKVSESKEMSR